MSVLLLVLAAAEVSKPSLTVVVRGAPVEAVSTALSTRADVELRVTPPPNAPSAPVHAAVPEERIAAARNAYVNADFGKCLTQVDDDAAVVDALAQLDRGTAARALLWRIACDVGANRKPAAAAAAHQLVGMRLEVPAEVGQVSPEAEAVLAAAMKSPPAALKLEVTSGGDAAVELDGRPAGCSTPCSLEVQPGLHVVRVTEEGKEPAVKAVRVEGGAAKAAFELQPAAPELAAAQWTARYAQASDFDGARSAKLLSTALRASRLVILTLEPSGRQQALLAVDGNVTARGERLGTMLAELPGLMDDVLVRGQLIEPSVPLYKRPLFWVAVVLGVAVVASVAGVLIATTKYEAKLNF